MPGQLFCANVDVNLWMDVIAFLYQYNSDMARVLFYVNFSIKCFICFLRKWLIGWCYEIRLMNDLSQSGNCVVILSDLAIMSKAFRDAPAHAFVPHFLSQIPNLFSHLTLLFWSMLVVSTLLNGSESKQILGHSSVFGSDIKLPGFCLGESTFEIQTLMFCF